MINRGGYAIFGRALLLKVYLNTLFENRKNLTISTNEYQVNESEISTVISLITWMVATLFFL
jgi:hypothetical protein